MTSDYLEKLVEIIDDAYCYEAGPVGGMICEEALEQWKSESARASVSQLHKYVELLMNELPDEDTRKSFAARLDVDEALHTIVAMQRYLKAILS